MGFRRHAAGFALAMVVMSGAADRAADADGPGPHRIRISPYDPAHRVWVINETFHQIYVFANDGKQLLKTLGEKKPLQFVKLDFTGRRLYTWLVPSDLPDGYLEVHALSVDSAGNLYGGDNQYGRTQKFVPKPDADPALLIQPPWRDRSAAVPGGVSPAH